MKVGSIVAASALVAVLAATGSAAESADKVAAIMQNLDSQKQFNGSVLVAKGGKVIYGEAFGMADGENDIPTQLDTQFRIASITKGFTAVLALQAIERGELDVQKSIVDYLPGVTNSALADVTVEHLLNHTSGIEDFSPTPSQPDQSVREALVERLNQAKLVSKPGEEHKYCNVGYTTLGFVLENATGKTYEELLQTRILGPLKMDATYLEGAPGAGPHVHARGYTMVSGELQAEEEADMSLFPAAGAIVSTAPDLLRFSRALSTDDLLTKRSRQKLLAESSGESRYGCRNLKIPTGDRVQIFEGGMTGSSSLLLRVNDGQYTVVLLSNLSSGADQSVARALLMAILRN